MADHNLNSAQNNAESEQARAIKNEALDWFMRMKEDCSPEIIAEFEAWAKADAAHLEAYERLEIMYSMPSLLKATKSDVARRRNETISHQPVLRRKSFRLGWKSIGFGLACMIMIAIGGLQFQNAMIWWKSDFRTGYGEQTTITLSDGSTVLLNTGSAIAVDYNGRERRVLLLRGDAFFDVQHDARHPFIVTGRFSDITVTGTAFGVQTGEKADTVVLERGSVEVGSLDRPDDRVHLQPGEMVQVFHNEVSLAKKADTSHELAWKSGRIIFHSQSFQNALNALARYYSGTVLVLADTSKLEDVSGNYRIDDPETALRTFAAASNLTATRLPGNIFILR